jgi:DNA-directed RNA polymerase specialized sigma24 family protein
LQEAILKESYERYVAGMPAGLRRHAELFLQGYTRQEMAERMGCAERTVDRKLALVRQYWQSIAEQCITRDVSAL